MSVDDGCLRCGKCCWYDKNGRKVKCKHLGYWRKLNKTYCKIWSKRKFMLENGENPVIDRYYNKDQERKVNVICIYREQMTKNYSGCPFNKPEHEARADEKVD